MDAKARFHPRVKEKQKSRNHCGYRIFVELLSRFELETSSLPIGLDSFCIVWCFPVAFALQGLRDFFVSYLLALFGGFSARRR